MRRRVVVTLGCYRKATQNKLHNKRMRSRGKFFVYLRIVRIHFQYFIETSTTFLHASENIQKIQGNFFITNTKKKTTSKTICNIARRDSKLCITSNLTKNSSSFRSSLCSTFSRDSHVHNSDLYLELCKINTLFPW